jgi:hypothetical protein
VQESLSFLFPYKTTKTSDKKLISVDVAFFARAQEELCDCNYSAVMTIT